MDDKVFWRIIRGWTVLRVFLCFNEGLMIWHDDIKMDSTLTTTLILDLATSVIAITSCYVIIHAQIKRVVHYLGLSFMALNIIIIACITCFALYKMITSHGAIIGQCIFMVAFMVMYIKTFLIVSRIR